MNRHPDCEHGLPPGCPLQHRPGPWTTAAVWAAIALAVAAFWACVWFGVVSPLLDAWRDR